MAPKTSSNSLSEREMQLLHNYLLYMKTKPEVDMEKFAALSGFGGVPSARANIGRLLKKLSDDGESAGDGSPTKNGEGEDGGTDAVTPSSKKKSGGRKRKSGSAEVDGAEDETPIKKKSTPKKGKAKTAAGAASSEEDVSVKKEASQGTEEDD